MNKSEQSQVRILLVDGHELGSTARSLLLAEAGYTVETAENGETAWGILGKSHFDVVVTDYKMTGMTGIELIRLIREANLSARVILLAGRPGMLGLTEASTGADELIEKSAKEVPELLRAVKRLAARPNRRGVASQKAVRKTRIKGSQAS